MTTFLALKTAVARSIGDPDAKTFSTDDIADMVNVALAEIGRIAPSRFQEDVTPVADTLEYTLGYTTFGVAVPEIEVRKVEVWDGSTTPATKLVLVDPADAEYTHDSDAGWKVWDGVLELPRALVVDTITGHEADYLIRVWGYCPYVPLSGDADVVSVSNEREWALRARARVEGLQRLADDRALFTQWQTRSGNTDTSFAGLLNSLNLAQEAWRRQSRAIAVLREAP